MLRSPTLFAVVQTPYASAMQMQITMFAFAHMQVH